MIHAFTVIGLCLAVLVYLVMGMADMTLVFDTYVLSRITKAPKPDKYYSRTWNDNPYIKFRTSLYPKGQNSARAATVFSWVTFFRIVLWPIDLLLYLCGLFFVPPSSAGKP